MAQKIEVTSNEFADARKNWKFSSVSLKLNFICSVHNIQYKTLVLSTLKKVFNSRFSEIPIKYLTLTQKV